jgi:hypothetical protein
MKEDVKKKTSPRPSGRRGCGDFHVTCRIGNKPLKLGIDTAADEEGKALHEICY